MNIYQKYLNYFNILVLLICSSLINYKLPLDFKFELHFSDILFPIIFILNIKNFYYFYFCEKSEFISKDIKVIICLFFLILIFVFFRDIYYFLSENTNPFFLIKTSSKYFIYLITIISIYYILFTNTKLINLFFYCYIFSYLIEFLFFPNMHSYSNPWQFNFAYPVSLIISLPFIITNKYPIFLFIGGLVNTFFGFLALGLLFFIYFFICFLKVKNRFLTLVLVIFLALISSKFTSDSRSILLDTFPILSSFNEITAEITNDTYHYEKFSNSVVTNNSYQYEKFSNSEVTNNSYQYEKFSNSEDVHSFFDINYFLRYLISKAEHARPEFFRSLGYLNLFGYSSFFSDTNNAVIKTHSHILQSAIEGGVVPLVLWIIILLIIFKVFFTNLNTELKFNFIFNFSVIWVFWNVLFSPFMGDNRFISAFLISVIFVLSGYMNRKFS